MNNEISIFSYKDYVEFFNDYLNEKRKNDISYSQAEFAKDLGLTPPRVSQILKNKEGISVKKAKSLIDSFDFSEKESEYFFHLVSSQTAKSVEQRNLSQQYINDNYQVKISHYLSLENWELLDMDRWDVIWSMFEITNDFSDLKPIARVLKLSPHEISDALDKMVELDLIYNENGIITRRKNHIVFGNSISSQSIRNHHKRKLIEAIKALDSQGTDIRKNESITFSLKKSQFKKLSDKVEKFVDDILNDIDENDHDDLATLTVALYSPLK